MKSLSKRLAALEARSAPARRIIDNLADLVALSETEAEDVDFSPAMLSLMEEARQ